MWSAIDINVGYVPHIRKYVLNNPFVSHKQAQQPKVQEINLLNHQATGCAPLFFRRPYIKMNQYLVFFFPFSCMSSMQELRKQNHH